VRLATLKQGKKSQRTVPLPADVLGLLAVRINQRGLKAEDRVFPLSRQRAFELVRDGLAAAGVERKRANPRALRHGCAVHALRGGMTPAEVQRILGHRFLSSTGIYLRITAQDIARSYNAVEW
jgi:integrase/recombinase XerD